MAGYEIRMEKGHDYEVLFFTNNKGELNQVIDACRAVIGNDKPKALKIPKCRCDTCKHEKTPWFFRCADCYGYELWEGKECQK